MKLVNLRDERDVAMELLNNWSFDAPNYAYMDQFRISSTAIYPFQNGEDILLLRFSPEDEREKTLVQAELNYIEELESKNIHVAERIASKSGENIIQSEVNGKTYIASVFKRVKGQRADRIDLTKEIVQEIGMTLASIHTAQAELMSIKQHFQRPNYLEKLNWARSVVERHAVKDKLVKEIDSIEAALKALPKSEEVYGLIQYDFELDNLFYDEESNIVSVIDFDDSHYHWYYMDIINFLDNLDEEIDPEKVQDLKGAFLTGYREKRDISDQMEAHQSVFKRYSNMIGMAECLYSISDLGHEPPEWMYGLRDKLEANVNQSVKNIL